MREATVAGLLVVGIGSSQGDDQLGWQVARRLQDRWPVRLAGSPAQLLDWLEGIEHLVICDACRGPGLPGSVRRWQWPAAELQQCQFLGSHDLGVAAVLALAERLGRLPQQVVVWTVVASNVGPAQPLSTDVAAVLPRLARQVEHELRTWLGTITDPA